MFFSLKYGRRCLYSQCKTAGVYSTVVSLARAYQSSNQTTVFHTGVPMANSLNAPSISMKSKVYVYSGYGCSKQGSRILRAALNNHVDNDHHQIVFISPEDIIKGDWAQDALVLVFGGGFDLGFIKSLGPEGIQQIHDYVWKSGGQYLGICAGAYFASDRIEFDKGGPLEVCGERHLKFYPGQSIGPAYAGFDYHSSEGAVAAPIDVSSYKPWADVINSSGIVYLYTDGGGFFTLPSDHLNSNSSNHDLLLQSKPVNGTADGVTKGKVSIDILAKFRDLPDSPPAIVKCDLGSNGGKAILSCVHFEYDPELLKTDDPSLKDTVLSKVAKSNSDRQLILNAILKDLGINTQKIIKNSSL